MGRYPLIVTFYSGLETVRWHKIFKLMFKSERFYHVGIRVGDTEIFTGPLKRPVAIKTDRIYKLWKPELIALVGFVDVTPDNIKGLIPENYIPTYPLLISACAIFERTLFCPWVPKSCFSLACIVLNKLGIEIPLTSSPTKIRRWLHENNFVLWESRYWENNCSKGTHEPSV